MLDFFCAIINQIYSHRGNFSINDGAQDVDIEIISFKCFKYIVKMANEEWHDTNLEYDNMHMVDMIYF